MNGIVGVALLVFVLVMIHSVGLVPLAQHFLGAVFSVPVFHGGPLAEWFNLGLKLLYLAVLVYVIRLMVVRK